MTAVDGDIRNKVMQALACFVQADGYLLLHDVNERSISHKFAEHLQVQFPDWNVDCEYNRDMDFPKRLQVDPMPVDSGDTEGKTVYPDIIVHKRGTYDDLLVIEIKKKLNADYSFDLKKIREFTKDQRYKYKSGLFIELPIREQSEAELLWYTNGNQIDHQRVNLNDIGYGR